MGGYLDTLHASPPLKTAILGWTTVSLAVPPSRLSLAIAARLTCGYLEGLCYPQGGSRAITDSLADAIRRHGGELLLGTEVSRILADRKQVRGVRVRSAALDAVPEPARDILAPVVVSGVDVKQTYLRLLPPESVPARVLRRVRSYEFALPLAAVYLVLDRDLAAEGYTNTAHIVSDADDLEALYAAVSAGELPEVGSAGAWIANLADPHNPRLCPPGRTNIQLLGLAPAQHSWWGVAPGSGLTARYAARKRQLRDQFVRLAERAIPDLPGSIVYEETATPITDERFMRCTDGTSYGPAFTPRQAFSRLGATGAIAGLYHAGASVRPSHGLVGTLASGLAAASAVTSIPVAELQARTAKSGTVSVS